MGNYLNILKSVALFKNIEEKDLGKMLVCLNAKTIPAKKGEIILMEGDEPKHIGIVLSGMLHIAKEDIDGNRNLMAALGVGDFFAETLCCAGVKESPVSVFAEEDAQIMLLDFKRILNICPDSCRFHSGLIENMLGILAQKNLMLQERINLLSQKNLRAKVLNYLKSFKKGHGKNITIPFDRQEMADFLCVDRSALSHELSRMKREGIIDYWKNEFKIIP